MIRIECSGTWSPSGSRLEGLGRTFNRQVCGLRSTGLLVHELLWEGVAVRPGICGVQHVMRACGPGYTPVRALLCGQVGVVAAAFPGSLRVRALVPFVLSPGSTEFLSRVSTGQAALAYWPGRNQPRHSQSHLCAAPGRSGRSPGLSGDGTASVPGLAACGRASRMWPRVASP